MPQPKLLVAKKREAQDRFLALIAAGHTKRDSARAVNRDENTVTLWCANEPWFKDRYYALKNREAGEQVTPFVQFRKTYFGFETPWHQQQMIDAIEASEPRSVTMILLPPGGGKTTVLEDYFSQKLAENPDFRIADITETRDLGRKILRRISNRMTDDTVNEPYIRRYGPFRPSDRGENKPWNADILTHVQAKSGERDYSFEVKGAGSSIYGAAFDLIVLDDIQSIKTLNKTEMLLEYFRQTLYSRIMRANSTGRIVIIGTRQGPGDFYEELLRDDVVTRLVKIPALDEHGNSYFPKKTINGMEIGFSEDDLLRIRAVVGEEAWSRQYMQEPVSKRGQTFSQAIIARCLDDSRGITHGDDPSAPGMLRIAALDPALAGHAVFRVAGIDYEKMWLLDGRNEEGLARYEEMWDIIDQLSEKWHPAVWVIEGNAIQGGIARSDRIQEIAARHGFIIQPHQTGRNKQDDMIGVASMAGSFMRQEISIPNGTDEARQNFAHLLDELPKWRADIPTRYLKQDEVMCLWFLHLEWHRRRSQFANRIDQHINIGGLPYQRTRYQYAAAGRR